MSLEVRDEISPALAAAARRFANRRPILEAMGQAILTRTQRAFNEPAIRPLPWAPKKDGSPATLRKNQLLVRSWHIADTTNSYVVIGSDRPYAAVHQFGSRKQHGRGSGIPARPMLPFIGETMTTVARRRVESAARKKIASMLRQGLG